MHKKKTSNFHCFSPKIDPKFSAGTEKRKKNKKNDKMPPLTTPFSAKVAFLVDLGVPAGSRNRLKTPNPISWSVLLGYLNTRLSQKRAEGSPGGLPGLFWRPFGSLRGQFSAKIYDKSNQKLSQNPLPHARNMLEDFAKNQA